MLKSILKNFKITGLCSVIPEKEISIDNEIETLYRSNKKQVQRLKMAIGLGKRRVASPSQTAADLCKFAAEKLLNEMEIDREELDALIYVSQSPDYIQPATSFWLQKELGLTKKCAVFDVNLGCSGYAYGLWLTGNLIQTGSCKKALLLAGDTMSKAVNLFDKTTAPIFGDGGSATLLEYTDEISPSYFVLGSDGGGYDAIMIPAGGYRRPFSSETAVERRDDDGNLRSANDLYMDGGKVFRFTISEVPESIRQLFEFSKMAKDDIDHFVLHQANKFIVESVAEKAGLDLQKVPSQTFSKFGNQSVASIPVTMSDTLADKLRTKELTLLLSGYGIGLSWCSCIIKTKKIYCPVIAEFGGYKYE